MPTWISHRGLHTGATENSLEAFRAAVSAGFHCLETDLRSTLDGVIVLSHDDDLKRVSGVSRRISRSTWQELKDIKLNGGEALGTFAAFVQEFAGSLWIFDVKPEAGERTIRCLQDWAEATKGRDLLLHQARFLFWRRRQKRAFQRLFPSAEVFASEPACYGAALGLMATGGRWSLIQKNKTYSLTPRFAGIELYTTEFIDKYHSRGARVLAFLPSTPEEVRRAVAAGCDDVLLNGDLPGV